MFEVAHFAAEDAARPVGLAQLPRIDCDSIAVLGQSSSVKASVLLHCAHSLASAHDPSDVWLICPADGAFDRPGLLLGGATRADDAAFARVKVHTCDGHAALVKLLAATHLLPAAEVPAALVLDDGDLALLAPAAAAHARTQERALAFGMALLQSTLQDWRKRTGRVTQLVVGLPQAPEFMLFVALRSVPCAVVVHEGGDAAGPALTLAPGLHMLLPAALHHLTVHLQASGTTLTCSAVTHSAR